MQEGWISTKEARPKLHELIVFATKYKDVYIGFMDDGIDGRNAWWIGGAFTTISDEAVTHWRPLPNDLRI